MEEDMSGAVSPSLKPEKTVCPLRALVEISKTILPTGFTGPQRNEHRIKADPAKWQEDNGLINSDTV